MTYDYLIYEKHFSTQKIFTHHQYKTLNKLIFSGEHNLKIIHAVPDALFKIPIGLSSGKTLEKETINQTYLIFRKARKKLLTCLSDFKELHSMIVPVGNIEMTMQIKG